VCLIPIAMHEPIVRVYGWMAPTESHPLRLVMERGMSALRIQRSGLLTAYQAVRLLVSVASGLVALHAKGIVHRDIALRNVLYVPDRRKYVIADFGLSRLDTDTGVDKRCLGCIPCLAPEAQRGEYSRKTDSYLYGCLVFEVLKGKCGRTHATNS
jgi:serine/threonine protein kinase